MADFSLHYGARFKPDVHPALVEMTFIRGGGYVTTASGQKVGLGLFGHYRALFSVLWPEDDHHRWSDLILKHILEERITVLMGARDTGKTRTASKWALCDYFCFPEETLTLMTSTTINGLERRVWGDVKTLHERAKKVCSWLAGHVADSKHGLFTDSMDVKGNVRDMRKGISAIPLIDSQGQYMGSGLREFVGIKQNRRRLIGDEIQHVPRDYLKALDSLDKLDFKAVLLGNPIADNGKALDEVSEPIGGWKSLGEVTRTRVWKNRYQGITINLVGTDSPNFDKDTTDKFPYLIDHGDAERAAARPSGKDSIEWWSQIMGVRKSGAISNKVLTVEEIEGFGGFGDCIWQGGGTTKVYAIDAGFGGDPCVRTYGEFGKSVNNEDILLFGDQKVIPILVSAGDPEGQIARYAKADCDVLGVPYSHVYFDAGMYATLAVQMARILSPDVNAVNFGGTATQRPVSADTYIYDEVKRERRLKTCYEHYSKFVTELWFSVRLVVHSRQARKFPREAAEEFNRREWRYIYDNRYELEPKDDYKLRNNGESPNNGDSLAILVEGARRLGFEIKNLRVSDGKGEEPDWLQKEQEKYRRFLRKTELNYAGD